MNAFTFSEQRTKTADLLRDLRNWHPDHEELMSFFAGVASMFKTSQTGVGSKCIALVVDFCDEASGCIENDLIEQQSETAWNDRVQRPLSTVVWGSA